MSILQKVTKVAGVNVEVDQQHQQKEALQQRQQEIINVYWWLREKLDESVSYFFQTGSYDEVEKVCRSQALAKIKRQLEDYHNKGIVWEMPERRKQTNPQVIVLGEKENSFICEEKFLDFSVLRLVQDGQTVKESRNTGQPTASNSTVAYDGQGSYWFEDFFVLPLEG